MSAVRFDVAQFNQLWVDISVQTIRGDLRRMSLNLLDSGEATDEDWACLESLMRRADLTFGELRNAGFRVDH